MSTNIAPRISVSALMDWARCNRLWYYQHHQRLRPIERDKPMGSGSALDACVQYGLGHGGKSAALGRIPYALGAEFGDGWEKYRDGLHNAISRAPAWLWEGDWRVQGPIEVTLKVGGGEVTITGRPDLVRYEDEVITILDIKTTQRSPLELLLTNPQLRYYATMHAIKEWERNPEAERPVQVKYLCMPTQGKPPAECIPWPLTSHARKMVMFEWHVFCAEIVGMGAAAEDHPNYHPGCKYCTFYPVCTETITKGDPMDIIKQQYRRSNGEHTRGE